MPLKKPTLPSAQQPSTAPAAEASAPAATAAPTAPAANGSLAARLKKLDAKDAKILVQGTYQAALHSVGAVQHGGKSPEDYANRVDWLAQTIMERELTLLGH